MQERRAVCQVPCDKLQQLSETVAEMTPQLEIALEGVGNYRKHAERANRFFDRFEAKADAEERAEAKRWKRSDKIAVAAILAVVLLPPVGWSTAQAVQFFHDLYEISLEWHAVHKGEIPSKKSIFEPPYTGLQSRQQTPPQDAATRSSAP